MIWKYLIVIFVFILIIAFLIVISQRVSKEKQVTQANKIYFYNQPSINISKIKLKVFYAVPKNKEKEINPGWKDIIENSLKKIVLFHQIQFRNKSTISYDIYSQPFILTNDDSYYNSDFDVVNNKSLLAIAEEIEKFLQKENSQFLNLNKNEYNVLVILYEGSGAFGAVITDNLKIVDWPQAKVVTTTIEKFNGVVFVSFDYLVKSELKSFGDSIFYHELAHTLGIPDKYENNINFSLDIMGAGRFEPLENNYLDQETLTKMGL